MKALAGIKMSFELQRLVHKVCDIGILVEKELLILMKEELKISLQRWEITDEEILLIERA